MMSKLINFLGAPGVGKSTLAADLFAKMKKQHYSVEYVAEFAKEKVWESNFKALHCQPYITGTQLYYLKRLEGQVDYIITDSPIILGAVYNKDYPQSYNQSLIDTHKMMGGLSYMLLRDENMMYEEFGRRHGEEESRKIEGDILRILEANNVSYKTLDQYTVSLDTLIKEITDV